METIKGLDGHFLELALIHAAHIHALALRMRPRHIKGLDPAVLAEGVLSHTCIESVGRQHVFARKKAKPLRRYDQVDESDDCAYGAVAVQKRDPGRCVNFELHGTAVAGTLVGLQGLVQG